MIKLRRAKERGHGKYEWLETYHSFSFDDYYDPEHMGFRVLRVINEDTVEKGEGFPMHPHKDMEIITYVTAGALEHKDSMGNCSRIIPGELQRMSAGTGIRHSEYNPLQDRQAHLLQIWIYPEEKNLRPDYEQKNFAIPLMKEELVLVASRLGEQGSLRLNQDVKIYALKTQSKGERSVPLGIKRYAWIQVLSGELTLEGEVLHAGDGCALSDLEHVKLTWKEGAEFLFFDLP